MSKGMKIFLGLLALLLMALLCTFCHQGGIEADLKSRTTQALADAGIKVDDVVLNGRDVTLAGKVGSESLKQKAAEIAAGVWGVRTVKNELGLGDLLGTIKDRLAAAGIDLPDISLNGSDVTLNGVVPSLEIKNRINAILGAIPGIGKIIDNLTISAGDLLSRIKAKLTSLGFKLPGISLDGKDVTLDGEVATAEIKNRIGEIVGAIPGVGKVTNNLLVKASVDQAMADAQKVLNNLFSVKKVEFRTSEDAILRRSFPILDEVATVLKKYPTFRVAVRGHTDSRGDEAFNEELSQRRADAVREYLIRQGVARNRLSSKGFGSSKPLASNSTAEGRQSNRRVEFALN